MNAARNPQKRKSTTYQDESRGKLMRAIRAACRRLGVDDDTRRDTQESVIGKGSMTDMTNAELGQLLDHFNRGWKGPMGHKAFVGKIRALWWTLYWLAEIDSPNDRTIDAFIKRQTGASALVFLDHRGAASVIEALKSWATRAGVIWIEGADERRSVLDALTRRLAAMGYPVGVLGADATWREQDMEIAILGKILRTAIAAEIPPTILNDATVKGGAE